MKQILALVLVLICSLSTASDAPKAVINEDVLREKLLEGNLPILIELNHIHQAKDKVNIARGNLLPSISLTGVAATIFNPTFALGAIQFLVPFLIPSNWFDYFQSKDLMDAEKQAYYALQLNTYASAMALYHTLLGDQALYEIIAQEYKDLEDVYEILKQRDEVLGNVSQSDLLHAKAQADQAGSRAAKMKELLIDENSQIRQLLALPFETEISYAPNVMVPSTWENKPIPDAVTQAITGSPEAIQLDQLLAAAKSAKWSKVFAFISGATVGSQGFFTNGAMQNASFSQLVGSMSVNFGFAYYPAIQLTQKNIDEIKLRQKELRVDNTQILEKVILSIKKAEEDLQLSTSAEKQMFEVYKTAVIRLEMGMETVMNVLLLRRQASEAAFARVQAQVLLNQFRVTLNRTMIEGSFGKVKGCNLNPEIAKKMHKSAWEWIKRKVSGSNTDLSIDQACSAPSDSK